MHAIDDVQRKIKLRNIDVTVNKGRFHQNQPSNNQQNTEKRSEKQNEPIIYKESENKIEKTKEVKQPALVDVEKVVSTFNLQTEISKLKVSIHFNELLRNRQYRDKIKDMVRSQGEFQPGILEVADDAPTIVFGSKIESVDDDEAPPFYLSLNVHDMMCTML